MRMRRAISEYIILGIKTTLPLHYAIMNNPQFIEALRAHAQGELPGKESMLRRG